MNYSKKKIKKLQTGKKLIVKSWDDLCLPLDFYRLVYIFSQCQLNKRDNKMKKMTEAEFEALPKINGKKQCPGNTDYSEINIFEEGCIS